MPRQGPRRPLVAFKLDQQEIDRIDRRAAEETKDIRSEMIRRMLAYAALHMPKGWQPTPAGRQQRETPRVQRRAIPAPVRQ